MMNASIAIITIGQHRHVRDEHKVGDGAEHRERGAQIPGPGHAKED